MRGRSDMCVCVTPCDHVLHSINCIAQFMKSNKVLLVCFLIGDLWLWLFIERIVIYFKRMFTLCCNY